MRGCPLRGRKLLLGPGTGMGVFGTKHQRSYSEGSA